MVQELKCFLGQWKKEYKLGHLVEKYTDAYFLRKNEQDEILPYGVEGIESFLKGELREHDQEILEHIKFTDANVLEFGFGRGETIKYIWEQGVHSYVGVDFSPSACRIAKEFLEKFSICGPEIICADAVEFIRNFRRNERQEHHNSIDIVMMLDFIEHVPRAEVAELLDLLKPLLSDTAVIVVNTPDFLFDNDVISEGLNEHGSDSSDVVEETRGMHCNRYTLESLRCFFTKLGYNPISRGHYFVLEMENEGGWKGETSYGQCWEGARNRGCWLKGDWPRERFETAYELIEIPELYHFEEGNLQGISLYLTKTYLEYYQYGNYDAFLYNYVSKYDLVGKTVFDLGAFVGVNSMQFARLVGSKGTVCAFEPNVFNRDRLRLNVSENPDLDGRIRIFPYAVSDVVGTANFKLHRNVDAGISSASYMDGAHTTLPEEKLRELGFTDVEVDVCTIDEFVERSGYVPHCIKIDIEGAEHLALLGALKTLKKHHPILLVELHSIFCTVMLFNALSPLGYVIELFYVEPDGRCFIGANAEGTTIQSTISHDQAARDIQADITRLELGLLKEKCEAGDKISRAMAKELNSMRDENLTLKGRLSASDDETSRLKGQLVELQQHIEEQQATITSQQAHLLRYQMFPVIRVIRRLRRMLARSEEI